MASPKLSPDFVVRTRDQIRESYLRSYRFRVPLADTGVNTQPFVDASNFADQEVILNYLAAQVADATDSRFSSGQDLDDDGAAIGVPRQGVAGSTGYITISAATGGGLINAGTQLQYTPQNLKFQTLVTGVYQDGAQVAIQALNTGPSTNLAPSMILSFISVPPGIGGTATVFQNTDGSGLIGGADQENDDDYRRRQNDHKANPPAASNMSAYVQAVESLPGISIQKAFCYPAALGPGTVAVCFTMRPAFAGASRIPNGVTVGLVQSALTDTFGVNDGIVVASGSEVDQVVCLGVLWKTGAGWLDLQPWPTYLTAPVTVSSAVAISAGAFRVTSASIVPIDPIAGQTIGLYDPTTRTFKRKRILTVAVVSAGHTYDLTFDLSALGVSDTSFVPASGAIVSPWADSLNSVVGPVLDYMTLQGPGEMFASFPDPGVRQRRFPAPTPDNWPSAIGNKLVDGVFAVAADAVVLQPTVPASTAVGTPGVLYYLHHLSDLGVFPE